MKTIWSSSRKRSLNKASRPKANWTSASFSCSVVKDIFQSSSASFSYSLGWQSPFLPQRAKLATKNENSRLCRFCQARRLAAQVLRIGLQHRFSCSVVKIHFSHVKQTPPRQHTYSAFFSETFGANLREQSLLVLVRDAEVHATIVIASICQSRLWHELQITQPSFTELRKALYRRSLNRLSLNMYEHGRFSERPYTI